MGLPPQIGDGEDQRDEHPKGEEAIGEESAAAAEQSADGDSEREEPDGVLVGQAQTENGARRYPQARVAGTADPDHYQGQG